MTYFLAIGVSLVLLIGVGMGMGLWLKLVEREYPEPWEPRQ